MKKEIINLTVNGTLHEISVEPQVTLNEVLREQLDLTGTKLSCGAGECGACTVLIDGKPELSCCTLAMTANGKDILTIEGLARDGELHPLQKAFVECGAIQCGFCTPGMLLTSKALLDENPDPTREEVKSYLSGNLCRCTGYVKIVDAVLAAATEMNKGGK
ncbi:MAG: (2Fe-2S)-binding protein [Dehalococcoidia bacterium]|nr:(2Fe-2S)-binding protein [Dehalococcoidia bacterium]